MSQSLLSDKDLNIICIMNVFLQDEEFEQRKQKAVRTVVDVSVSISLCLFCKHTGVHVDSFVVTSDTENFIG